MRGSDFDEAAFFGSIEKAGLRALLIGRRALVVLGLPVLTADYDLWLHVDDADRLNAVAEPFGLLPTQTPAQARARGRYVLQNDERVDVLVARSVTTVDGLKVEFDQLWGRRQHVALDDSAGVFLPALDDLITTKRFAARPKDLEDIRLLEVLREEKGQ
jgi:hypothetical protein